MNPSDLSLADADLRALSNVDLEDAVAHLSAQLDVAEHRLLTLIRELDRRGRHFAYGHASLVPWLGWRTGLGPTAAREKVRVAKALGELPKIDAALSRGEVSYSKVRAMTRIATPANEEKLLRMATQGTAAQLERICRGVEQVSATSPEGQARWLRTTRAADGMVVLEARLHADEAALVMKALELARETRVAAPDPDPDRDASAEASSGTSAADAPLRPEPVLREPVGRDAREARSRDNADALVAVAEAFIGSERAGTTPTPRPGGERHQLLVCIKADELHPTGVSAELAPTGAQVPPETLRRMACDASVATVAVDGEGAPLDVGRKRRTIPPAIRRALHVRDGGCCFPGCTHRSWLDAHHIDHWADGGETAQGNLVLLCAAHHRFVHEGGGSVTRAADGAVTFRDADGRVVALPNVTKSAPLVPLRGAVRAPRPPSLAGPPDYHWAIGVIAPNPRAALAGAA